MRFIRPAKRRGDEINMAPLIDMVFILLVFFAVSTTFAKDLKVDIDRPAVGNPGPASTKSFRVYIDRAGAIYLDEQPVKPWMIQSRVRDLLQVAASRKVLVVADGQVATEKLIEVVDQCRLGGATEVAVAAERKAN